MQNKWGCFLQGHCGTCYTRLTPLVQSHKNTDNSATLSIPGKQTKDADKLKREKTAIGRSQHTREHLIQTLFYR